MPRSSGDKKTAQSSRRAFLKRSAAVAGSLAIARGAHAAGQGGFKIGLIGCGGRGSGAAGNAMNAGKDIKLVALADIFDDKLQGSRQRLKKIKPDQVAVDDDHCFVGFDAYQKVLASDIDVVLIACASHFHPAYLTAAVDAGKHVFCEKPHSLDAPGLKPVAAACEKAKQKGLAVVSGLCNRYGPTRRETVERVRDGQIGEIVTIQASNVSSPYRTKGKRDPSWSEMEWQFRNWYHLNWLAGDQCQQQLIHDIDVGSWVMRETPPVDAWGMGGRSACFGEVYGDIFDHQSTVFQYANGVRMFGLCRNQNGTYRERSVKVFGTKGIANIRKGIIEGEKPWRYRDPKQSMFDVEHKALFDSIRVGKPINNGDYMVKSSMLAILAQMVCNTGQRITWEQAVNSKRSVQLPRYGWDVEPPVKPKPDGSYAIPIPGITKFV